MRGTAKVLCAAGALLALAACGTATPYQPAFDGKGYVEQRLEDNRFRISFTGNSLTPRETVEDYVLYRAAELTLQTGNDWFLLTAHDTSRDTVYHTTFPFVGFHGGRCWDCGHTALASSTSFPIHSYESHAYVLMYQGSKPATDPHAYDARDVINRLAPKIVRPQQS